MSSTTYAPSDSDSLVERLVEDMNRRWQRGERVLAEEYLTRWPEVGRQSAAALEIIYEEICLRREHGEAVPGSEVFRRFPQWQAELARLLDCHRLLQPSVVPRFPLPGETVGEFRLVAELGRGSAGRVFLATQSALADRPVVLKVVRRAGQEHKVLARLQHTNIVPLYAVEDDPDRNLRLLCMPYFGGMTLTQLLQQLQGQPPGQRSGQDVRAALRQARAEAPVALPDGGPVGEELDGPCYTRAICWLGACLADALQYAHARGLVHLDLKPSNVLLAADGQPMLLDFHLARAPVRAGGNLPDWLGGTPGYMAPEQEAALTAVRAGQPVPMDVDGRADVYALGLLLYEALGGTRPVPRLSPGRVLRIPNPRVSVGLADILGRCLVADPRHRYPTAAALAEDLRRHLADWPLRGAGNRSVSERLRKWRRRQPYAPTLLFLLSAVVVGGGFYLGHYGQQYGAARAALAEGDGRLEQGEYSEARAALQRGFALAQNIPFTGGLTEELHAQLRRAEQGEATLALHRLVERIRPWYGAEGLPRGEVRTVATDCKALWDRRSLITQQLGAQSAPGLNEQVRADMLDLAILWSDLRVRFPRRDQEPAARQAALNVLDEAEAMFGPSCALDWERRTHAAALGTPLPETEPPPPRTAWEHYTLGRALLRAGDLVEAERHLGQGLDCQPPTPWPRYYHGLCAYRLQRYQDAARDFTACVTLAPDRAWCYYNRGLACARLGEVEQAESDYDRALDLEPKLADAALNRGMLHYQRKLFDRALSDLRRARDNGADPAAVAYDLALVHLAQGDRAGAVEQLREALRRDPAHKDAAAQLESLGER
jgi:serine/threonine protein kinase/Flp pilus assembly protein TadD